MGAIQDTNSELVGMEVRSESSYLSDNSPDKNQMYFCHQRADDTKNQIIAWLKKKSGEAFEKGRDDEATKLREVASLLTVSNINSIEPHSIEVTHGWLRDLYVFMRSNPALLERIGVPQEGKPKKKAKRQA